MKKNDVVIVDNMEAGELELRKVFEKVITDNVKTIIDFTQDTRKMQRDLEDKVDKLERKVAIQQDMILGLNTRVAMLQENARKIE